MCQRSNDDIIGNFEKPVTCRTEWNWKIRAINNIILMLFFIFDSLWISVTFDTSIIEGPSKKFWIEDISTFHMIPITQNLIFCTMRWVFPDHITYFIKMTFADMCLIYCCWITIFLWRESDSWSQSILMVVSTLTIIGFKLELVKA